MNFRKALPADVPGMQRVRHSVKENVLSDPALVTDDDCVDYITRRGKGFVCEADGRLIGFSVADLWDNNVWALFVDPAYEGRGVGRRLHQMMLDWYFSKTSKTVWLSTAPASRADRFYRKAGWQQTGFHGKGEVRFEMTKEAWTKLTHPSAPL